MNKVEAIIRPEKFDVVKGALVEAGLIGLNVVHVTGHGAERGVTAGSARGVGRQETDMLPKVKVELVVRDEQTQTAIDTIIEHARTGNVGDGEVFVYPVSDVIRVRTGERGEAAL